jgi:glycerol-1-phosphate dehydrogenase [NAD(P)+]
MSDASVFQFLANPVYDEQGILLLATALMLNGVAMEIAGSSRPASGSEHLISHALDMTGARARLHGLQTGTAAYLVSSLQAGSHHARIGELFARTGFWESVRKQPFSTEEWRIAVEHAPSVKGDFYTILSERDAWPEFSRMIAHDPALIGCFE